MANPKGIANNPEGRATAGNAHSKKAKPPPTRTTETSAPAANPEVLSAMAVLGLDPMLDPA